MVIFTTNSQSASFCARGRCCAAGCGVRRLGAVLLHPRQGARELLRVVDLLVDAPGELGHVDHLVAHAQPALEEPRVHDGAGDAHGDRAHGEVRGAAHAGRGEPGPGELQELLLHVGGDAGVAAVLHVPAVDAERGQALLRVRGEDCREVDRARPLGAVEAPDRLRGEGIHVHGLGAVAPARGDGEGHPHALAPELLRRPRRLGHPADARVRDDALHGQAARVADGLREQIGHRPRHGHGLALEGLPDPFPPSVDGRPDTDLRQASLEPLGGGHGFHSFCAGHGVNSFVRS